MNVLLTGATGFLGRHIHAALRQAGHSVVPVARSLGHDFAHLQTPGDWAPVLQGVDAVVNAVGIIGETRQQRFEVLHTRAPQALLAAAEAAGIRRVVQISAQGADATAFSAYHLSKRLADDTVRSLRQPGWVLRPGLVFGPGGASQALFLRLARLPRIPVLGDGQQAVQPVYVGDVVSTVLACLAHQGPGQTLDLVRPEPVAFADWLRTLRQLQGLPPTALVCLPWALAHLGAAVAAPFLPMARSENLRMLRQGHRADATAWLQFWGQTPTAPQATHLRGTAPALT
ncbi:NAD-dependent epimerase/dehydratase family protein [Curvibacter sp. APW13]|uniref:NAD-dependent epimerase/dehydratase family protein n=1 Tax=Curvibacter sp. APW13 TaxID=3077236 RepID=UPI0028DD97A6|nr:NAD-dependent epimerase/dehydratase family protein [Curvibacter sp. APW13]MDT8990484.1 NAD-dependent epimerase/dehydratase family protein [Curvibacter sp. APW13]